MANPAARKPSTSWMIAELIDNVNILDRTTEGSRTEVCFSRNPLYNQETINASGALTVKGAYVSHGSTIVAPLISNLSIYCSQRTTSLFLYDVLSK
jgi:hypothetical protein